MKFFIVVDALCNQTPHPLSLDRLGLSPGVNLIILINTTMTTAVITNKQTGRKRKLTSCKEVESNRVTYRVQNYLERLGATIHGYNNTITPNGRVSTIMYSHPITDAMAMMTITTNN